MIAGEAEAGVAAAVGSAGPPQGAVLIESPEARAEVRRRSSAGFLPLTESPRSFSAARSELTDHVSIATGLGGVCVSAPSAAACPTLVGSPPPRLTRRRNSCPGRGRWKRGRRHLERNGRLGGRSQASGQSGPLEGRTQSGPLAGRARASKLLRCEVLTLNIDKLPTRAEEKNAVSSRGAVEAGDMDHAAVQV